MRPTEMAGATILMILETMEKSQWIARADTGIAVTRYL